MRLHLVHISKTGGTALATYPGICGDHDHDQRLSDVPDPAIVILRDPVERFISAFDMYRAQRHITEPDAFLADLEANASREWPGHGFRPQSWWVDERGRDVVVLRTEWLDALFGDDLPPPGDLRRNEARRNWAQPPDGRWTRTVLTPDQTDRVKRFYEADYRLLETLCQP